MSEMTRNSMKVGALIVEIYLNATKQVVLDYCEDIRKIRILEAGGDWDEAGLNPDRL